MGDIGASIILQLLTAEFLDRVMIRITLACAIFFEESIGANYENDVHGYRHMVACTTDGEVSFTSNFPFGAG